MSLKIKIAENYPVPEFLLRSGIKARVRQKLAIEEDRAQNSEQTEFNQGAISTASGEANQQHYEVPAAFYQHCLGDYRKYSSCFFPPGVTDLSAAELASLKQVIERAELKQLSAGAQVLELGCGWGSFSLFAAAAFPELSFTGVSNSSSQRQYIMSEAKTRGLTNLDIITADINKLELPAEKFSRIVSIEMFEHLRNYQELFARISQWLNPTGKMFVHVFCHKKFAYNFNEAAQDEWMAQYFFTGGVMPSFDLFKQFDQQLMVERDWFLPGTHYQKTADCWAANLKANKSSVMPILAETYGADQAGVWYRRWFLFYLACSELFGYDNGEQWGVGHYLFKKK